MSDISTFIFFYLRKKKNKYKICRWGSKMALSDIGDGNNPNHAWNQAFAVLFGISALKGVSLSAPSISKNHLKNLWFQVADFLSRRFLAIQGKTGVNPFGLTRILTQKWRKSADKKHGSDYYRHPKQTSPSTYLCTPSGKPKTFCCTFFSLCSPP